MQLLLPTLTLAPQVSNVSGPTEQALSVALTGLLPFAFPFFTASAEQVRIRAPRVGLFVRHGTLHQHPCC